MNLFGRTDIGAVRSSNQDAYLSGYLPCGAVWTAVCDGMGGANGGNVASAVAIDVISSGFEALAPELTEESDIPVLLKNMIEDANRAVYEKARQDASLAGMGTTAVLIMVYNGRCTVAHVGDSRAYLFRGGALRRLTEDHSIVQELVRLGELTEEQARSHPRRNVITRAVGVAPVVEPDVVAADFLPGDVLLSCTDGLTGYMSDGQLGDFMRQDQGQELVDQLLDFALQAGGADNITVSVIQND